MLLLISRWNLWVVGVGSTDQTRNLYNEDGEAPQHCAAVRGEQPAASLLLSLSLGFLLHSCQTAAGLFFCFLNGAPKSDDLLH
jgi:ankyrin repeat protein